ncbi:hypothetical protein LEN26_010882 [Aphanomyces euteiches]|nr:hypothetical protein LEN26_010882 [Aphanomyces euteiches]
MFGFPTVVLALYLSAAFAADINTTATNATPSITFPSTVPSPLITPLPTTFPSTDSQPEPLLVPTNASTANATNATARSDTICPHVNVEDDAAFCVSGSICRGNGNTPAGAACPQVGSIAVAYCNPTAKSYNHATELCIAPVSAVCQQLVATGAWGCVWPPSSGV